MSLTDDDKLWVVERMEALELRITERMDALEQRIPERTAAQIEATETKLLTAFHNWGSPVELKLRSHPEAIRAVDLEIEAIGNRVANSRPTGTDCTDVWTCR
jgi:hypothetical protein